MNLPLLEREWSCGRTKGGWHDVGWYDVDTTRSGAVQRKGGMFWTQATVYGPELALEVCAFLAGRKGDRVRPQTLSDLRDRMFSDSVFSD